MPKFTEADMTGAMYVKAAREIRKVYPQGAYAQRDALRYTTFPRDNPCLDAELTRGVRDEVQRTD